MLTRSWLKAVPQLAVNLVTKFGTLEGPLGDEAREHVSSCLSRAIADCGLDPENPDWKTLAGALAVTIYSGTDGSGRPKTWRPELKDQLLADVKRLRTDKPRLTEEECCKILIKQEPYSLLPGTRNSRMTAGALLRQLQQAKKPTAS